MKRFLTRNSRVHSKLFRAIFQSENRDDNKQLFSCAGMQATGLGGRGYERETDTPPHLLKFAGTLPVSRLETKLESWVVDSLLPHWIGAGIARSASLSDNSQDDGYFSWCWSSNLPYYIVIQFKCVSLQKTTVIDAISCVVNGACKLLARMFTV